MRILTIILAFFYFNTFVFSEWTDHWISAQESIENGDLLKAEEDFTIAINIMEANDDMDHPYVYIARAELYHKSQRFLAALEDLNRALSSNKLAVSEKHNAILMKISAKFQIGENLDGFDLNNLVEWSEVRIDETADSIIIRNLFDSLSLKENLDCLFMQSGLCEKLSDIKVVKSGTYIIKKNNKNQSCGFCNDLFLRQQPIKVENRTIEGCKAWCDLHVTNAQMWCSCRVKTPCRELCLLTLINLQKGCHWCCSEGAFYEKCVAPFGEILSYLPHSKYDPEWED